jgi:hypothetical protein
MSIRTGWWLFFRALISGWWSLGVCAEWMFKLNVFARHAGRHPIVDQIYDLKNVFIRYLYESGYCYEAKLHSQRRLCYSCSGTGVYWTGEECWKCDGTGVFAVTRLYAFRFEVAGRRYAWHQLARLVDYDVALTEGEAEPYVGARDDSEEGERLTLENAVLGCGVLWLGLLWRRRNAELMLFTTTHNWWSVRLRRGVDWMKVKFLDPVRNVQEDDVPF